MKTFYAAFFFCITAQAGAQTFLTIPDSGAFWSETYAECNPPIGTSTSTTYELYSHGDTTINTFTYTKIYESGHGMNNFCGMFPSTIPPDFTFQNQLRGFIRETGTGQVYYRSVQMTSDTLLFDYNRLIPGQEFPNCFIYDSLLRASSPGDLERFYVTFVDSVAYNSLLRRRYNITGYDTITSSQQTIGSIIEGIGSSFGLLNQLFYASGFGPSRNGALYCYREDNLPQLLIGMGNSMGCFTFYSVPEGSRESVPFTISPNPAAANFEVRLPENYTGKAELVIYNLLGQPVYQFSKRAFDGNPVIRIDFGDMPAGMYEVHLRPENGIPGTRRLIIR